MKANLDRVVSVPAWPLLRRSAAFRRAVESLLAAVALVPCLPLMGLTAIVVWINLGRPLFFKQVRAGIGMRTFTILKFRTMTEARGPDGELLADELRQTKLTALLRRLRFDELPQLLSILRGDMSLVGPRPLPLATVAAFGELGRLRCLVAPGLTGWAQVNGNTRLSDDQKIALDLWYVGHASLRLDGLILLLTLKTIILGEKVHRERLKMAEEYLAGRANLQG